MRRFDDSKPPKISVNDFKYSIEEYYMAIGPINDVPPDLNTEGEF